MTSILISNILGLTYPYNIYVCDVYGNSCIYVAEVLTSIPPTIEIVLPTQFDMAPAVGIKIIASDGCERFNIINCISLPITPTPTTTNTPTPTPTTTNTPTPTPTTTNTPTPTKTLTPTPTPTNPGEGVVTLSPFDYMIVTYFYDNTPAPRDLDSRTSFANTGTIEDGKWIGCGQSGCTPQWRYRTPICNVSINDAYLFQPGDDNGDGQGESILINFKNLISGLTTNNDIEVKLEAGWCKVPITGPTCDVTITTYSGGTLSIPPLAPNTITSNGLVITGFTKTNITVSTNNSCCTLNDNKTKIGTINYNKLTKVASVTFN